MEFSYISLNPVPVTKPDQTTIDSVRTYEGIPSIEQIPSGRLFAAWYSGGYGEGYDNYALIKYSDDRGKTWSETVAVVDPPTPFIRAFDSVLWYAPNGKLYWFWAQSCAGAANSNEVFDGIAGVYYSILENPDDTPENFRFSPSRRIANGIMLNKPTVLKDGTWALPCSIWHWQDHYKRHESLGIKPGAYMVVSTDQGEHFSVRSMIKTTNIEGGCNFDEHIFIERKDGSICCYIRTDSGIAECISKDGGYTWETPYLSKTLISSGTRFFLKHLRSGKLLAVINASPKKREKLTAFLSEDDGLTWNKGLLLEAREGVSYPDAAEGSDGIYITYDRERYAGGYILMSRVTEEDIMAGQLVSADSVLNQEIAHSAPCPVETPTVDEIAGKKA